MASVPAGPSRTIAVAYRAFSTDAAYAAMARIIESVQAGVQLGISPRRTGSEGTITLTGRVLGPVPPQGVIVDLLVHYRGRWEPFRTPRTDAAGHFTVVYQFRGRARALSRSARKSPAARPTSHLPAESAGWSMFVTELAPLAKRFARPRPRSLAARSLVASQRAWRSRASASAGTYPMYQCAPGVPAVSPGWSVFGNNTNANTVLSNSCSAGGSIGDYVFTDEQAGAVTENGESGSQVGLRIDVPGSAPGVTIHAIKAEVIASAVTGDDAFLEFASAGQSLPGAAELPYGGSSAYTATESWTLPQGARDFEAYVNCSTDRSSPTCDFADSIAVPALTDITLSLEDNTPPTVASVSGPLAAAAAADATVAGSQPISFTGSDAGSGVRTATLTLSPLSGGAPYVHTFDFSARMCLRLLERLPAHGDRERLHGQHRRPGRWRLCGQPGDHRRGRQRHQRRARLDHGQQPLGIGSSCSGRLPGPGTTQRGHRGRGPAAPNGTARARERTCSSGARSPISRDLRASEGCDSTGRLLDAQGLRSRVPSLDVLQQIAGATTLN